MGMRQNRTKYPPGFWEEHKNDIINEYVNNKKSADVICKQYDCDPSSIIRHLREWGVSIRNSALDRYNGLYDVDIHYFDNIDTEHKAYWLGYIFADGHISKNMHLMFGCQMEDIDILERVKEDFNCTYPIRLNKDNNPTLNICSKHICETLVNMGFTHIKSYEVDFQKIITYVPQNLLHHFVRGMFDGDGSIRCYNYDYATGYQYHFGYTGLKEVCEFVAKFLKLKTKIIRERDTDTYTLKTANAPMIKYIYGILYKDATIYCQRKYDIFQEILRFIKEERKDEVKGVAWYPKSNKWMAACHIGKKNKTIGYYDTKREAETARLQYEYDTFGLDSMQWFFFDEYGITTQNN